MGCPFFTCCPGETNIRLTGPLTCEITGVVRKLLYATVPFNRRTRGQLVGWSVTIWTCESCSFGTVNSSVLLLSCAPFSLALLGSPPEQPDRIIPSAIAAIVVPLAGMDVERSCW